jgi:hypothetical protein
MKKEEKKALLSVHQKQASDGGLLRRDARLLLLLKLSVRGFYFLIRQRNANIVSLFLSDYLEHAQFSFESVSFFKR